jgi:hypothetical protein
MLIKLLYPSPRRSPDHALGPSRWSITWSYSGFCEWTSEKFVFYEVG